MSIESEVDIREIGEKGREHFENISEKLERYYRGKFSSSGIGIYS